jgi:ABC-type phosphate transport system substrate-binding protein
MGEFLRPSRRPLIAFAMVLIVWTGVARARVAAQPQPPQADIAVIVHSDVAVDNLTIAELRRILLGDREFWSTGLRVSLLIRAPVARERDVAVKDVCQMTEAQFRSHWIGKVFRNETSSGPRIVYSAQMALDQVSRTPGAISFVESSAVGKGVKVLKIDGRSPGQQGYRLR